MEALTIPFLGTAFLLVLIVLGEYNTHIARLLCAIGLHVWPEHAASNRHRVCRRCEKREHTQASQPHPWDWH
jgi:hypothetical protein